MIEKTSVTPLLLAFLLFSALFLVSTADAQPPAQGLDSSSYRLIGTIMADGFVGAVLVDAKGEQTFYRLRDQLPDGSLLVKVKSDSILVQRSDNTQYEIFISHDTKTAVPQAVPPSGTGQVTPEAAPERELRKERQQKKRERKQRALPEE